MANGFKDKLSPELREKMHFFHMDADELLSGDSYDYIFMVELWEHLYEHQIESPLKKIFSVIERRRPRDCDHAKRSL